MISSAPLTIKETQEGLKKKDFSAVELVDYYLNRIEKFDKDLNSFITVTDEVAYEQAKEVDQRIAELGKSAFEAMPLLGVTVAHKDLYMTENVRSTAGSKVLSDYVPAYSSTVVERMEKAGSILLGKANCDPWGHGGSGENSDFGPTKNPWDKTRVPGGSSSGSGAAVAAGFSLVATGTDTGGSVRSPASFCNLVGLKPTYGVVSRYGVTAMTSSTDTMGQLTHSVEDIERLFNKIKGSDGRDSTVINSDYSAKDSKLKIGVPKEYFGKGVDSEVDDSVQKAIKEFEKQNIEFVEVSLPHTKYAISVYYIVMPAETSSNLARYGGIRYGNDRSHFGDEAKRRIMLGTYVLSSGYYDAYYKKAMQVRSRLIGDFDTVFEKVDAIIAPVSPTPAFKLDEKTTDPLQMYLADIFTVSANLVGIPGLAIPSGFTKSGLPLGFQLMGPRFSESLLFKLGKMYQESTDWHLKTPNL